jgi:hypothetical protein
MRLATNVGSAGALAVYVTLVLASCGGEGARVEGFAGPDAGSPSLPNGGPAGSGSLGGGDAAACSNGVASSGCACTQAGQTAACWTGPADKRNVGMCHDGTTQCVRNGEFTQWGPCQGEQLNCGGTGGNGAEDAGGAPDTGTGTGGMGTEDSGGPGHGSNGGEPCGCVPGSIIWCDEDCIANIYCSSHGQKNCLPDGTWGPCQETMNSIAPFACEHVGLGCASCNNGQGFYLGNCAPDFPCTIWQPSNCSVQGQVNNGVAQVTCDCH